MKSFYRGNEQPDRHAGGWLEAASESHRALHEMYRADVLIYPRRANSVVTGCDDSGAKRQPAHYGVKYYTVQKELEISQAPPTPESIIPYVLLIRDQ